MTKSKPELHEYTPGRWVEIERDYTPQRWPPGAVLLHRRTRREVIILQLEYQGYWAGHTGYSEVHGRIERFIYVNVYRVRVPHLHEDRYLAENEMREP